MEQTYNDFMHQFIGSLKTDVARKQSTPNFPKNKHFLSAICKRMCPYQWVRNVRFLEKLACFVFLLPSFEICLIATKFMTQGVMI